MEKNQAIDDLSEDILFSISQKLMPKHLAKMSFVSKKWHQLSEHNTNWKDFLYEEDLKDIHSGEAKQRYLNKLPQYKTISENFVKKIFPNHEKDRETKEKLVKVVYHQLCVKLITIDDLVVFEQKTEAEVILRVFKYENIVELMLKEVFSLSQIIAISKKILDPFQAMFIDTATCFRQFDIFRNFPCTKFFQLDRSLQILLLQPIFCERIKDKNLIYNDVFLEAIDNLILLADINFNQLAVTTNPTISAPTKKLIHVQALQRLCDHLEQINIIPSSLPATITNYLKEVKEAQSTPFDSNENYDYLDPNKLSQNDIDTALLLVRDALLLPVNNLWIKAAHQDLADLIGKVCEPQLSYVPRP